MKCELQQLKIIIASTPKTGNTWLRHILAGIYDLPMVELCNPFNVAAAPELGACWIGQEHYYPQSDLLCWAEQNNAVLITAIRHPGDVLISFCHYVRSSVREGTLTGFGLSSEMAAIADDDEVGGPNTVAYVRSGFQSLLNISIAWIYSGKSHVIRYEDLWRDPVAAITQLTAHIQPVPLDSIERAVEMSDLSRLRGMSKSDNRFYRRGNIGGWREELPAEVRQFFRECEPYPSQFAALGYTLNPADSLIAAHATPRRSDNPFRHFTHFDNGVMVPPVAVRMFLMFESATARQRWPKAADTQTPDSFFDWLNAPTERDPHRLQNKPMVTNLAAYLHRIRADVRTMFPDMFDKNRVDYILWFLRKALADHQLDPAFIRPVRESLLAWAATPDPDDYSHETGMPVLTNLATYIYRIREDLQRELLDIYGEYRISYLFWFMQHAAQEHELDPALVAPIRTNFLAWAAAPDQGDRQGKESLPMISNLAAYLHRKRPDVQVGLPDLYEKDRLDYHLWFYEHAVQEYELTPEMVSPMWRSFVRWANRTDPNDPHKHTGLPLITNFAAYVYRRDPVLQRMFPDLYGLDRMDYLICLVLQPQIVGLGSYEFTQPILQSWAEAATAKPQIESH